MAPRFTAAFALVLAFAAVGRAQPEAKPDAEVLDAIKKGRVYLQNVPVGKGGDFGIGLVGGNGCGPACLAGLALIESGLPTSDRVLVNLAQAARRAAMSSSSTYEISLLIMFLDRYGAKADEPFIQLLTLRLMSGQSSDGGWSYSCLGYSLDQVQQNQLHAEFAKGGAKLVTPDSSKLPPPPQKSQPRTDIDFDPAPPKKEPAPKKVEKEKPAGAGLHPLIRRMKEQFDPAPGRGPGVPGLDSGGDHSNTQFATVGLWCGRRHHVDVANALARLDSHYRKCQGSDGGWGYTGAGGGASPAMTCAGLMGLAMGFGAKSLKGDDKPGKADEDAIDKDRAVSNGLKYLGDYLSAAAAQEAPRGRRFAHNDLSRNLYFMWSLERVGMTYGLTTIGRVDWYDWGSKLLVDAQNKDGSWSSDGFHSGSPEVATSFALLFLSRANLAQDLSTSMKGKIKDPGTSSLKSGKDLDALLGKSGKPTQGTKTNPDAPNPKVDPGTTAPKTDTPPVVGRPETATTLADALVAASPAERAELIKQYRDTKGGEYTDALAKAIAKMVGEGQIDAREALATRLTRMTATTLNELMRDRDKELRRAAALATGHKGKERLSDFAENLIRLIGDDDTQVTQAARTSLKTLSDKDFGPEPGVSAGDRGKAMLAWREWWKLQAK